MSGAPPANPARASRARTHTANHHLPRRGLWAFVVLVALIAVALTRSPACAATTAEEDKLGVTGTTPNVTVFPGPGWNYASPLTSLTLVGAEAGQLRQLSVVGSTSGVHDGSLRPLVGREGAVFSPDRAFAPNERVTVRVGLRVRGAGGTSFSFRTAEPVQGSWKSPAAPPLLTHHPDSACSLRRRPLRTVEAPEPVRSCTLRGPDFRPRGREILVSPRPPTEARRRTPALMIFSDAGQLLWYRSMSGVVHDLNAARYRGKPVLTYFLRAGHGPDRHEVLDEHYKLLATVVPGNGYSANAHEFQLTEHDTAYIGMYAPVRLPRSNIKVTDYVVQEIDVATGDVLFEWHALDHVPPSASYAARRSSGWAWDYFHGNSIEPPRSAGHTIVVSARNTSAIYGIDRATGDLRWILGGKQDQFGLVDRHPAWQFCAQHDARRLPDGDLSVFDNGTSLGEGCPGHRARVLRFRLDTASKTVELAHRIPSDDFSDDGAGLHPSAVGSTRWREGDALVNWGNTGRITEISGAGRLRFTLQLAHWTYRAVLAEWHGRPPGRPAVAARRTGEQVDLWASWNGATEIHRWRILAGTGADDLRGIGESFRFADLETRMRLRSGASHFAVQALDRTGRVLGESSPVGTRL